MDVINKQQGGLKCGEVTMAEKKREVMVAIPNEQQHSRVNSPHRILNDNEVAGAKSPPLNCASPEIRFITSTHNLQNPKPQISVLLSFPTAKLATKLLAMHTNTNHSNNILAVSLLLRLFLLNSTFL